MPTPPVRILHLSDLHFHKETDWHARPLLKKLVGDVKELVEHGGKPDAVAITGDVAFSGSAEEYELAAVWLRESLLPAAKVDVDRLFMVPGNHDVDRGARDFVAKAIEATLRGEASEERIADALQSVSSRNALLARHAAWLDFANRFRPDRQLETPWWSERFKVGPVRVHLAGLASTLASGENEERGRLLVGLWQVHEVLRRAEEADLVVALLHHPWDWLAEWDAAAILPPLRANASAVLRGHLHDADAGAWMGVHAECLEVAAGACHGGLDHPHAYSLLELDPVEGRAKIHLRRWHPKKDRWIPDRNDFPPDGVAEFPLRRTQRAIAPPPAAPPRPAPERWHFFLAHAKADAEFARDLKRLLGDRYSVFLDEEDIAPGDRWDRAIRGALLATEVVVVLVSRDTVGSYYVAEEVARAIGLAREGKARVVPVWLEGMPKPEHVPYGLLGVQGIDAAKLDREELAQRLAHLVDPERVAPAPDPLAEALAELSDLDGFLRRKVDPAKAAEALADEVEAAGAEGPTLAARLLRERKLLGASFVECVAQKVPRHAAELRRLGAGDRAAALGPSLGPAPLPASSIHLDRIHQWNDVVTRSGSSRHELFLLHGPRNQFLADFTERVVRYLNAHCVRSNAVRVVQAEADGHERPNHAAIWETRFAATLAGRGDRAVPALRQAALHEPVFVLVGDRPFSDLTAADELEALLQFLSDRLGFIVNDAAPPHPLRLYVAVEESEHGGIVDRFRAALGALASRTSAGFPHTPRVTFPPWPDVEAYVCALEYRLSEEWWSRLRSLHATRQSQGGHFRAFCTDLDKMLHELREADR